VSERQAQLTRQAVNYTAKLGRAWPHMLRHAGSLHGAPRRRGNGSNVTSFAGLAIGANVRADPAATHAMFSEAKYSGHMPFRGPGKLSVLHGIRATMSARRMAGRYKAPCRVAERAHR